jgi:succinate-semialdehyde dehydrogenase / glutarate-semialdehyde dehydrogenase
MFKSVNPYDQLVIAEFPLHDDAAIRSKLTHASKAFELFRKESFDKRSVLMANVAKILRRNLEEYARIITMEMGKPISESRVEIDKCARACEYYSVHAEVLLKDKHISTEAKRCFIHYQPIGAVLAIMPWNFPFWQVFRFAVPTLMAGNVALLKHAPNVCKTSLEIEKIFLEAGFPEGVFQSLVVDVDKVESILQHDIVQAATLTGSEYAGSQLASLAGKNIKKSVLELGGSDPFIVLPDADFSKAAEVATQSRMRNAGQSCIAAKRFIVLEKAKEEFLHHFQKNIKLLKQGNPLNDDTTMGPMARLDLAEKLEKQLTTSVASGAKILLGGERKDTRFQPTMIDHVQPGMPAFDEETFGPLAAIITVKTEEEAITLANTSRYGLGSSIWTKDLEKAERLAKQIESGAVFVNFLMRSDVRLPFGGIKKSGYGREMSEMGIKEFMNAKTIYIE